MLELMQVDSIKAEIEAFRQDVEAVLAYTSNLKINNKEDASKALTVIAKSRDLQDLIKEKKDALTKEAKQYVKKVNNLACEFLDPLEIVEDKIYEKLEMFKFTFNEHKKEKEEVFGLSLIETFSSVEKICSESATSYEKESFEIELVDIKSVPLEFLELNEKKVREQLKGGLSSIPGVKITKTTKTIVKRV